MKSCFSFLAFLTLFTLQPLFAEGPWIATSYEIRYTSNDSPTFGDPTATDYSQWSQVSIKDFPDDWKGIGWFQYDVTVPPEVVDTPVMLMIRYGGALDIYIDGKLVQKIGEPAANPQAEKAQIANGQKAFPVVFLSKNAGPDGKHSMAIRYSTQFRQGNEMYSGLPVRFFHRFTPPDMAVSFVQERIISRTANQMFLLGAFLLTGLLFILMALSGKSSKASMYFGFFSIACGLFVFLDFQRYFNEDPGAFVRDLRLYGLATVVMILTLLRFAYALVEQPVSKIFYGFCLAGIVLFALTWTKPMHLNLINILMVLAIVEIIRTLFMAKRAQGLPKGFGIVWLGLAPLAVAGTISILVALGVMPGIWSSDMPLALYTVLFLAGCMMIYLRKRYQATAN